MRVDRAIDTRDDLIVDVRASGVESDRRHDAAAAVARNAGVSCSSLIEEVDARWVGEIVDVRRLNDAAAMAGDVSVVADRVAHLIAVERLLNLTAAERGRIARVATRRVRDVLRGLL